MYPDGNIVNQAWLYGHAWNPLMLSDVEFDDLDKLKPEDKEAKKIVASAQEFASNNLHILTLRHHNRLAHPDGDIGPATRELFAQPRCGMPDYAPPDVEKAEDYNEKVSKFYGFDKTLRLVEAASGSGSWPQPCQKSGVSVSYDTRKMPSSINLNEFRSQVFAAYAKIGLKLVIDDDWQSGKPSNVRVSWRVLAGSTIGLAEFNNRTCTDSVFHYMDPGYTGYMFELHCHELGHNCNLQHTRGGIMNPSIININPNSWNRDDPSWNTLARYFGGDPITPTPVPPTPVPPLPGPPEVKPVFEPIIVKVGTQTYKYIAVPFPEV